MNYDFTSVFFYCGIIGTVIFVLKTLSPIDTGSEISSDFTDMTDTDSSFNLLTIEGISAFFMAAGWMGYFALRFNYGTKIALITAIVSGLIVMLLFGWGISKFKKMDKNPTADLNELVGKVGKSYMKFEPKGLSKIEIEFNSKLEILDAKNNTDVEIESFQPIKVVKIENNVIYIEKE